MELTEFRSFSDALVANLADDARVLGIVAMGSMAERDYAPDQWSDHDFFVIVTPIAAETFRESDGWLPDCDAIALRFRETAHGVKVIYRSAHLVEFAVFTPDELSLARVNRYRVLLDRSDVGARMQAVARATRERFVQEAPSDAWLVGQFLSETLVAVLREARGEYLSAAQRRQAATLHLLRLIARHVPSAEHHRLDDLDASRRFELAYPTVAGRLRHAHASTLLAVASEVLAPHLPDFPHAALAAVQRCCD